jgi:hypothetical protein
MLTDFSNKNLTLWGKNCTKIPNMRKKKIDENKRK